MIVSHKLKFIFIANGKTGTSSIEKLLQEYQDCPEYDIGIPGLFTKKHIPPRMLKAILGDKIWNNYFKFCFVRNPWDWFVSNYFHNYKPRRLNKRDALLNPKKFWSDFEENRWRQNKTSNVTNFSEEDVYDVYHLLRQYRGVHEADSLFQYNYVFDGNGKCLIDFVGKLENIDFDFEEIKKNIGCSTDLKLPISNKNKHLSYTSYYTEATRHLINELYQLDIDTFGYSYPSI